MFCEGVLKRLSEFYDGVLDSDTSFRVSQHLDQCKNCRKEMDTLSDLHGKLRSLTSVPAPEYLFHLIQLRITRQKQESWRTRVKDALEFRWSRIRTTEGMWYWTRAMGTIMAGVFFCLISSAITTYYVEGTLQESDRATLSLAYRQQVVTSVVRALGMLPAHAAKRQFSHNDPAINDLYLLYFGESVAHAGEEDTLSILTAVDPSGTATVQDVLEYPADRTLLSSFNEMITAARFRPAISNGQAVHSHLVFTYNRIFVYD
jgi:hypothetical protein